MQSKALTSTALPSGALTLRHDRSLIAHLTSVLVTTVLPSRVTAAGVQLMLDGVGKAHAAGFSETGVDLKIVSTIHMQKSMMETLAEFALVHRFALLNKMV